MTTTSVPSRPAILTGSARPARAARWAQARYRRWCAVPECASAALPNRVTRAKASRRRLPLPTRSSCWARLWPLLGSPEAHLKIGSGSAPGTSRCSRGVRLCRLRPARTGGSATALAGRGLLPPTPGRVGGAVSLVVALPAGGVLSPNGRTPRGRLQALTRLRRRRPAVSAPCRLGTVQTGAPVPPYAALLTLAAFMIAVDVGVLKRTCPDQNGQRGDRSALSSPRKTIPHCPQPARRARMSSAPRVALAIASSPSTESKSSFLRALSCITFSSMVPAETIRYTRTFLV